MSYIYLASPYSDKSETVRHERYLKTAEATAQMLLQGLHIYSPIVHCHELAKRFQLPGDFDFWNKYNFAMLGEASALHILELPGWNKSKGIHAEIQYALRLSIPIRNIPYPMEVK